ncbi:sperm-associated antigen 16 protein-like [Cyprinodon tularosa]|uniref:sperm-associated antigen 16 protein-like n=1 Tax=Cyprinodon tularosa TaxID=77115 RepID=UPI0018E20A21|nr:sperm-associated antigen 16 protein-like [Cyprinodon tularosa]
MMEIESPTRNQMKQHGESAEDRDDSFKYEENFLKDEVNLVRDEDEEIITTQHRAEADPTVKTLRPTQQQLSMLDFFRHFLSQNEMTATMECLENEWAELVQKGELDDERIGPIPEVYTEIQSLTRELKKAVREKEEYVRMAREAAGALQGARRAREGQRLQHRRLVQENNKLTEDIERLRIKCDASKSEVERMSEKYKTASKQVFQMAVGMDNISTEKVS